MIFHQVAGATERPQAAETPQRGSNTRLGKETPSTEPTPAAPALDETARPDEQSADRTTGEQATGKERGTVVSIAGRLGRDPVVSERDGTVRVKLTVAEHYVDTDTQEEKTRWHEVWAASGTAEAVRDQVVKKELRQGTEVRIRGYEHRREKDSKGKQQPPFIRAFKITPTRKARQG